MMDPGTMSGDQNFYLALATLILGTVSTIVTAVITYFTVKTRREAKNNMQENRENLGNLAKAVNGKSCEAVANARLAGMLEGAKLEAERHKSPEAEADYKRKLEQAALEARLAALKANVIAHNAADKILEVPEEVK